MPQPFKVAGLAAVDRRMRLAARLGVGRGNRTLARALESAAPVLTGKMRGEIAPTAVRSSARGASARVVFGDPDTVHEEYGTADQDPRPFIRPTVAAERGAVVGSIVRSLRNL